LTYAFFFGFIAGIAFRIKNRLNNLLPVNEQVILYSPVNPLSRSYRVKRRILGKKQSGCSEAERSLQVEGV
jgi:hypothetical protein